MIDELAPNEKECNILISIKDVGGWVLKLRRNGNIFNNKYVPFSNRCTNRFALCFWFLSPTLILLFLIRVAFSIRY